MSELHCTVVAWMRVKAVNTIWNGFSASGFWIPLFSGILDSKSWILDSRAQYSGFHKQKFPGFRNQDYLTWGEYCGNKQIDSVLAWSVLQSTTMFVITELKICCELTRRSRVSPPLFDHCDDNDQSWSFLWTAHSAGAGPGYSAVF